MKPTIVSVTLLVLVGAINPIERPDTKDVPEGTRNPITDVQECVRMGAWTSANSNHANSQSQREGAGKTSTAQNTKPTEEATHPVDQIVTPTITDTYKSESTANSSPNTESSSQESSGGRSEEESRSTISTGSETTTDRKTLSCGSEESVTDNGPKTSSVASAGNLTESEQRKVLIAQNPHECDQNTQWIVWPDGRCKDKVVTVARSVTTPTNHPVDCENYRHLVAQYSWNVDTMMYAMQKESGCNPNAVGDNYVIGGIYAPSCGLLQVRTLAGRPSCEALKDPTTNIATAFAIWQGQGYRAWSVLH